jgi:NTP pyrophosphatase (non-canonical NTP hydrolase)
MVDPNFVPPWPLHKPYENNEVNMTTPVTFSPQSAAKALTFNEYQALARTTAIYPRQEVAANQPIPANNLVYVTLGLAGETGEVAEKIKKVIRDAKGLVTEEKREELKKELGDVLWYLANFATELGFDLGAVAQANYEKLKSRQERNVISGSGDNR